MVRLYNAAADEKPQRLMLGFEAEKVELVDLTGQTTDEMEVKTRKGKSSFEVQMPRFGFRTYVIYKK